MQSLSFFRLPGVPFAAGTNTERERIKAASRGDRSAFDALLRAYEPQLHGFLVRRVGAEAMDDLLQEIWLAVWVALPRYDHRARFKTWLYSIALHKCADYHRARRRACLPISTEVEAAGQQSVEDLYAAAELRETVQDVLRHLPETQREVLEMYYYAELTLPEIATLLKRNLNTVKYQFYQAHARVAQGLGAPLAPAKKNARSGSPAPHSLEGNATTP